MVKEYSLDGSTGDRVCTICGYEEWIPQRPMKMEGFVHGCPKCKTHKSMTLLQNDGLHHCGVCGHKQKLEDFKM